MDGIRVMHWVVTALTAVSTGIAWACLWLPNHGRAAATQWVAQGVMDEIARERPRDIFTPCFVLIVNMATTTACLFDTSITPLGPNAMYLTYTYNTIMTIVLIVFMSTHVYVHAVSRKTRSAVERTEFARDASDLIRLVVLALVASDDVVQTTDTPMVLFAYALGHTFMSTSRW